MTENIVEILFQNAEKYPQKIAIIHKNNKINYEDLAKDVKKYASYFIEKGLQKDDKVLIFVPMSIELYKILCAVFYIGAVAVFVDAWADKKRLNQAITIAKCKAFIGCPKAFILKLLSKKIRAVPLNFISGLEKFIPKSNNPKIEPFDKQNTALITFTTGSTGLPKAAKRTHEFLLEQHFVLKNHMKPCENDIDLTSLPIFVLHNLACAITSVIPDFNPQKPANINPKKILKDIQKHKITTSVGSPRFYEKLADIGQIKELKKIFLGGAPVFPKLAQKLQNAFPNTIVEIVYGSTEAEPISSITTKDLLNFDGNLNNGLLVGTPCEQINLKIIKPVNAPVIENQFPKLWLQNNEIGEICVEGKHVLKEYFNSEEAQNFTKIKYNNQIWHRTGDAGYIDNEGRLFLMGRVNNCFEYKGNTYYVFPTENSLLEIEGIEIGTILLHENKIILVIELKNNSNLEKIKENIKLKNILHDEIIIKNKIPRDPRHNSKIDYDRLKKQLF